MTTSNAFVNSVNTISTKAAKKANVTTTTNGAKAFKSTLNANVDFFGRSGSMRGHDIIELFEKAYSEDSEMALRNMLHLRDIRGGKGERQLYRDILKHLAITKPFVVLKSDILNKTSEVGRWDDLLFVFDKSINLDSRIVQKVVELIKNALDNKNSLCAKWLPRKNEVAATLRKHLGYTPKHYRKTLVNLTNVVETKMCANDWNNINFSHVPSKAMTIYTDVFHRRATDKFNDYKESLVKGEAKINANAVFPYEVYKGVMKVGYGVNNEIFQSMWNSLPNYMDENSNIIPVIDVSGSMSTLIPKSNVTCMDVAISLGAYVSSKAKGAYKGLYLTFDSIPVLETINDCNSVYDMFMKIKNSAWGMSTDIEKAFKLILDVAVKNNVSQQDMPSHLIIFSDMQFNEGIRGNHSGLKMAKDAFKNAGYEVPKIIFWNLNAYDNVPVKFDTEGVALVSGYNTSILKAVLSNKFDEAKTMTPMDVMVEALMIDRYNPFVDSV